MFVRSGHDGPGGAARQTEHGGLFVEIVYSILVQGLSDLTNLRRLMCFELSHFSISGLDLPLRLKRDRTRNAAARATFELRILERDAQAAACPAIKTDAAAAVTGLDSLAPLLALVILRQTFVGWLSP
jgi:hypothetical protein